MAENFASRYFRGQGALFLAGRNADGGHKGLEFVGDISSADLTPEVEREEVIENVTGGNGIGASWGKKTQYRIEVVFRSMKPSHLARIIQGMAETRASGNATDQPHTARHGKFSHLQHVNVSTVAVTSTDGNTNYTPDTDYKVHAKTGLIEWLSGGALADGTDVLVDYAYTDQHRIAANPGNEDLTLVFAGMNSADSDKQTRCELYKINLDPGVLGLVSDTAQEMRVGGTVVADMTRPEGDRFYAWVTED